MALVLPSLLGAFGCIAESADDAELTDSVSQEVLLGTQTTNDKYPWIVRVADGCHGVLIEPRWVLSAAHCVENRAGGVTVSYTRTNPTTGVVTQGRRETGPGSVFVHPSYDPKTVNNDIALVRLPKPLDEDFALDPLLAPVQLPAVSANLQGTSVFVASGIQHNATLPAGKVAVLRGTVDLDSSTAQKFAASSPSASLCQGDSGSGVIAVQNGRNVVVGIVSEGANAVACDKAGMEFSAVKVSTVLGWIRSKTGVQTPYRYIARSKPLNATLAAGSPSGYSYPRFDVTNIVYRDSSSQVREIWQAGGNTGTTDLTSLAGAPAAAADPTSFLSTDGFQVALYRGTDNQVHGLWFSNTGSVAHQALGALSGAPPATGNPVGTMGPDGWSNAIYRTASGSLEAIYWAGSQYGHETITVAGAPKAAANVPAAYVTPANQNIVAYRGTDNHIHTLYWTTGAIGHDNLSGVAGSPKAAGKPSAYYRATTDTHQVTYRGTDGKLYELSWKGSAPVQSMDLSALAAAPLAASDPASYYSAATNTKHVVYRTSDQHIHEIVWSADGGSIAHADLTAEASAPNAVGMPSAFSVESARTQHVVYRGTDNQIHEIRWQLPGTGKIVVSGGGGVIAKPPTDNTL